MLPGQEHANADRVADHALPAFSKPFGRADPVLQCKQSSDARRSEFAVDAGRAMLNVTCIGRIVDEDHLVSRDERRCPVGARLPHPRFSHGRT